jgi:uncharacterized short protein YbdD (DUF466 family)
MSRPRERSATPGGAAAAASPRLPTPASSLGGRLAEAYRGLHRTARLVCGIPDYQTYLEHHRTHHPDRPPMAYEEFFRSRLDARYGGKGGNARCC